MGASNEQIASNKNWQDFVFFKGVSLNKKGDMSVVVAYRPNFFDKQQKQKFAYALLQIDENNNFLKLYDLPLSISSPWDGDFLLHLDEALVVVEKSEDGKLLNHHYLVKANDKFVAKPNLALDKSPQYLRKYKGNMLFSNFLAYPYLGSEKSNTIYNIANGKSFQVINNFDYNQFLSANLEEDKTHNFTIKDLKIEENSGRLLLTYLLRNHHYLKIYKKDGSLEKEIVLNQVMPLKEGNIIEYLIDTKRNLLIQNYELDKQQFSNTVSLELILGSVLYE